MTLTTTAPPEMEDNEAQALFKEARRRRRRRRWWATGTILLATLLGGTSAVLSAVGKDGGLPAARHFGAPQVVGLLANSNAYLECPGSAHVGDDSSADVLPANVSRTDDLVFVERVAQNMAGGPYLGFTHQVTGLPDRSSVRAVRVGPGGGYVWSRDSSRQVEIVHVKNYGIYVYLEASSRCPTGGWARWANNGVQVTFLAPKQ